MRRLNSSAVLVLQFVCAWGFDAQHGRQCSETRRLSILLLLAASLVACKAVYREGTIGCQLNTQDVCPGGWVCEDRSTTAAPRPRCYRISRDAGIGSVSGEGGTGVIGGAGDTLVDSGADATPPHEAAAGASGGGGGRGGGGLTHGGAGEGGQGGEGGSAGSAPRPNFVVESVTPSDGTTAVDPQAQLVVNFSADLDAHTLDENSFTVTRNGQPVAGTFDLSARRATFTPQRQLALAATYSIGLTSHIHDSEGRSLVEQQSSFSVREGIWTVARLGHANYACDPYVAVADTGFAAVMFTDGSGSAMWASQYAVGAKTWSPPLQISTAQGSISGFRCRLAVNDRSHVVASWDYADGIEHSAYTTGPDWKMGTPLDGMSYGPQLVLSDTDREYVAIPLAHGDENIQGFELTPGSDGWTTSAISDPHGYNPQIALLDGRDGRLGANDDPRRWNGDVEHLGRWCRQRPLLRPELVAVSTVYLGQQRVRDGTSDRLRSRTRQRSRGLATSGRNLEPRLVLAHCFRSRLERPGTRIGRHRLGHCARGRCRWPRTRGRCLDTGRGWHVAHRELALGAGAGLVRAEVHFTALERCLQ
jgi:hypothetical protein